ncbi:MAG: Ycf66 family protein [Candidatus Bathyarchaeota archaeon]|nr:Ycf66 family protein [Candidatus Bathyarchaeota archaeon]
MKSKKNIDEMPQFYLWNRDVSDWYYCAKCRKMRKKKMVICPKCGAYDRFLPFNELYMGGHMKVPTGYYRMKTGSEKESRHTRRRNAKICYVLGIVLIAFGTNAYLYSSLYLPISDLPWLFRQYLFLFVALFGVCLIVVAWWDANYSREAVMVPCSYCSQPVPVTSPACPHCNAKRTD